LCGVEVTRKRSLLARKVYNCNGTGIIARQGVVHEGYPIALRRDAGVADPASGLVKNLIDRELQTVPATDIPHHGEIVSIR